MKAKRIEDNKTAKKPGEFSYMTKPTGDICGMSLCGPDGEYGRIYFENHPNAADRQTWKWDGNLESPTLHPSVDMSHYGGWHGWLKSGVLTNA